MSLRLRLGIAALALVGRIGALIASKSTYRKLRDGIDGIP